MADQRLGDFVTAPARGFVLGKITAKTNRNDRLSALVKY